MWQDQSAYDVRLEWGAAGLAAVLGSCDVAVIASLDGRKSPEAEAACLSFHAARSRIASMLIDCVSGRELADHGFAEDVDVAAQLNVSPCVPRLEQGRFLPMPGI